MSVQVNINRELRTAHSENNGMILALLTAATHVGPNKVEVIDNIKDLYEKFTVVNINDGSKNYGEDGYVPATADNNAIYQLINLEYLIRQGHTVLAYAITDITATEEELINEAYHAYQFANVIVPYTFLSNVNKTLLNKIAVLVTNLETQLYLDLEPNITPANIDTHKGYLDNVNINLAKVDLAMNGGQPNFEVNREIHIPIVFNENNYFGILASTVLAQRKAALVALDTPWIPVAGELNGVVPELRGLAKTFTRKDKIIIQDKDINLLTTKVGVGNLFVAQNTMMPYGEYKTDPLRRSHTVTQALWIKRRLQRIADKYLFSLNVVKTKDMFALDLFTLFNNLLKNNGLEEEAVIKVNIKNGTELHAQIEYVPVRAIEKIVLNVTIIDDIATVNVAPEGGNL